jgi:hypothetical protein
VWEADPNQLQFPTDAFCVTVDEFGGQYLGRLEEPDQPLGQS